MAKETKQCYVCKQQFRKNELVDYASPRAKILHSYCKKCLEEKKAKDSFSDAVCYIFGIKMPGPRIWTERKRLIDTYGYSDQTIVDCLNYLYNVKKMKKLTESICLVTPVTIHEMLEYEKQKSFEITYMAKAFETETVEHFVPTPKRKKQVQKIEYDPDEWLDD